MCLLFNHQVHTGIIEICYVLRKQKFIQSFIQHSKWFVRFGQMSHDNFEFQAIMKYFDGP